MDNMVKVVCVIQARLSSSRLPGKVMLNIEGKTLLERVIDRVKITNSVDEIYVATSINREDDLVEEIALQSGVKCFRGSLENVLSRFTSIASLSNADILVRVTADNPLTEPKLIDIGVRTLLDSNLDYVGFKNTPIGAASEVFTASTLLEINDRTDLTDHNLEHVTSFYYQHMDEFQIKYIESYYDIDVSNLSITVDTLGDYVKMVFLYKILKTNSVEDLKYMDYLIVNGSISTY